MFQISADSTTEGNDMLIHRIIGNFDNNIGYFYVGGNWFNEELTALISHTLLKFFIGEV